MAKKIVVFVVVYLLSYNLLALKNPLLPTKGVKIDMSLLLLGVADVEFDLKVHNNFSLMFNLGGGIFWPFFSGNQSLKSRSLYGGSMGLNWHPLSSSFTDGWYLKSLVRFGYSELLSKRSNYFAFVPTIGTGYEWFWNSGFWLSFGVDAIIALPLGKRIEKEEFLEFDLSFVPLPNLYFALGYVW